MEQGSIFKILTLMPFSQKFKPIYEEIQTAIEDIDFPCEIIRIDDIESPGNIYDDIEDLIKNSDLIIADITNKNANVLWELGYAHSEKGCERCIILKQYGCSVPFDLKRYRVIDYENSEIVISKLRKKIVRFVKNVIKSDPCFSCA